VKFPRGIKISWPGHRKEPQTFIRAATVDQGDWVGMLRVGTGDEATSNNVTRVLLDKGEDACMVVTTAGTGKS
jgi:hypothetical protein